MTQYSLGFRSAPTPSAGDAGPPEATDGATREAALSIAAVTRLAREVLEGAIPPLWAAGEVGSWRRHESGHCYFTLRDAHAQVRCVMFRADAERLPTQPENGTAVRVLGGVTLYERRGDFQLVVRRLEGVGRDGLWRLAFDRLKTRLERDGLLDPSRKRRLPRCPLAVGVVTSPVGAVFHDIVRVVERRAPWTHVVFAPARVQGDGAARELAAAIERLDRARLVDVIIVARGGGSMEDLWAFNEEPVARAIAGCVVPVVCGVGHETDVTIADLVADLRAPTPSAAAELVVLERDALAAQLATWRNALRTSLATRLNTRGRDIHRWRERLGATAAHMVRERRRRLEHCAARLDALSPLASLARGYAVPRDEAGHVLRRAADFPPARPFRLRIVDGDIPCRVEQRTGDVERT
ncbi:MAG: exodeoxyribonuclease VII large subunit [Longimicrobiales bacterium]